MAVRITSVLIAGVLVVGCSASNNDADKRGSGGTGADAVIEGATEGGTSDNGGATEAGASDSGEIDGGSGAGDGCVWDCDGGEVDGGTIAPCPPEGTVVVRRVSSGYEVVITDPPSWSCPDAALICLLMIGDHCFYLFSYSEEGDRAYFISDERFDLLQDGDPITGFYGGDCSDSIYPSPFGHDCPMFGYLDKAAAEN